MSGQGAAFALVVAIGACALLAVGRAVLRGAGARVRAAFVLVLAAGGALLARGLVGLATTPSEPLDLRAVAYRRSDSCRKCHLAEHASWHATWHRTMTQEVSPAAVLGDFSDVTQVHMGHPCRLFRRGEAFFMDLVDHEWERGAVAAGVDPASVASPPRRTYRVDRLVGSHELQVYLTRLPDGTYLTLPLEWNQRERRWVTSLGNYLQPEPPIRSLHANLAQWNETCIFCHNTRPSPGAAPPGAGPLLLGEGERPRYQSRAEELGIACEACHGPGDAHVAIHQDPVRRLALGLTRPRPPDPTIVHPGRLDRERSLELCGRCHGKFKARSEHYADMIATGDRHVPAQEPLALRYGEPTELAGGRYDEAVAGYFWPDGSPRPTAMEYQGVKLSPCFQRGEMTCLSCHAMHAAQARADQLRFPDDPATPAFEDDEACLQCHGDLRAPSPRQRHTRHALASEGSRCVNCHMPFSTFGLMKVVRGHRIVSPDAAVTAATRLPNGCNQCHVGETLAWTARHLAEWYGAAPLPALGDDRDELALAAHDLLQGHALTRAIAAHTLGWAPAQAAAPGAGRVSLLLEALDDEYAAVRLAAWVALRALSVLPGGGDYDYLASPAARRLAIDRLRARLRPGTAGHVPAFAGLEPAGEVGAELRARLLRERDRTPLTILE